MAAEGRTVKVSGLPENMTDNRLIDKVYIHFLRKRNDGGEIRSVRLSKTTPGVAYITFEDSKVALRLAKQGQVVFKVNETSYDVMVSLQQEEMDPDQVILDMTVTVDLSKLPVEKLFSLLNTFPRVHLTTDDKKSLCTLSGCYSEVQDLSSLIVGLLESQKQKSGDKHPSRTEKQAFSLDNTDDVLTGTNEAFGLMNPPQSKELDVEMESEAWKTNFAQSSSYSHQVSPTSFMDDKWDQKSEDETPEDFSLVVDSDIFCYLNKHCTKEVQNIVRRHRVEIVNATCQDITTLYIKPKKSLSGHAIDSVKKAHQDLAHLFQEKEPNLRKENIPRSGLPKDGLEHALENLKLRLPKLMINEDEGSIYLVGSKSDVSEAKQFFLDMKGFRSDLFAPSQSNFTFPYPEGFISPELSEQSNVYQAPRDKFQDPDELFNPRKDHQKTQEEEIQNFKSESFKMKPFDDPQPSVLQAQTKTRMDEDMSSARSTNYSLQQKHLEVDEKRTQVVCGYDKNKYTDPGFLPSKSSSLFSTSNLDTPLNNPDLLLEEAKHKQQEDTVLNGSEKQLKSQKSVKGKRTDSGRELIMAANFSGITMSSERKNAEVQKLKEDMSENERKALGNIQPQSLPYIKPSMYSNPKTNITPGSMGPKGKMDVQVLKDDLKKHGHLLAGFTEKKSTMMPAFSTESQSHSLSHMDLCGDTSVIRKPTVPSGSALKRSNSFSGRVKTSQDKPTVGQNERSEASQSKEVFTVDVRVFFRLWHYLNSVYSSEIDNLTSDLQIKEIYNKDSKELTLHLKGANTEKVKECHRGLKKLIDTIQMDFDMRTLPLSMFGLTDCKDKTLLNICTEMEQSHEKVNILVMSKSVLILGPKAMCQEVEEAMLGVFNTEHDGAKTKMENLKFSKPSTPELRTDLFTYNDKSNSLTDQPGLTQNISSKDSPKMLDQSYAYVSKNDPSFLEDQTRETSLEAINKVQREQGNRGEIWSNTQTEGRTQLLDKMYLTLKVHPGADGTMNKASQKTESFINSGTEDYKLVGDQRTSPSLQKNTDVDRTSQVSKTFTKPEPPGSSVDQLKHSPQSDFTSSGLSSHLTGNQDLFSSCMCCVQSRSVNQTACGLKLCSKCEKLIHNNCKRCSTEANRRNWGIKGTMTITESTLTIPGFIKDTTLKIVYDIPDGIQGEGHPCPGAPFKGKRFEAFLPNNRETVRLVPLLMKAFDKGLTFTVKSASTEEGGTGFVVWGSIPHKTRVDSGKSQNGYPDSSYINRLTRALRTAGIEE